MGNRGHEQLFLMLVGIVLGVSFVAALLGGIVAMLAPLLRALGG
jgi:hypothetical protein